MTRIQETTLPGVGVRHDFVTAEQRRIGVITHRSGRRDLIFYAADDPDRAAETVHLTEDDVHTLADVLGAAQVSKTLGERQQQIAGVSIDWLPISDAWSCAGGPIKDTELRAETGVTIIAVVRDGETVPAPGPDFVLKAGDTAVVVGTPDGIRKATGVLSGA